MKPMIQRFFVMTTVCMTFSGSATSDDFKIVKDRVVAELVKSSIDDGQVMTIISKIEEDGSFNDVNYVDLSRTAGFPQRNHVLMRGEVTVSQNCKTARMPEGSRELAKVKWVHQDRVGYIFPEPTTVNVSNKTQEGRWSDITDQKNISDKIVLEKVFMIWLNHGDRPTNASYRYRVVPNVTEQELNETSDSNRNIKVLSNTSEIQAVKHSKLEITQIVFYKTGEVEISSDTKVRMDCQGMAMIRTKGNRIEELSVSDPSRKLGRIRITVSGIHNSKGDDFFTIPNRSEDNTLVLVDLPQGVYAGKSVTVEL